MNINSVRNIKPGSQFPKRLFAVFLSIAVIAGAYTVLSNAGKEARDTVDVIRVRAAEGIPAKTLVTKDMLEKYSIIRKEYTEDMATYGRLDEVTGKYTLYYIRGKSFIYKDQLGDEKPLRNEWLYKMDKSKEVLTMPYEYLKCGGDILVPGDLVRVRISYVDAQPQAARTMSLEPEYSDEKAVRRTEIVLDNIKVMDQLNSSGHSVYEAYKDVLKLSPEKRQETMRSRDFMNNITAKSLVLEVTSDQIDKYTKYSSMKDASFIITLLSRRDNQNIIDEMSAAVKEAQAWVSEGE